MIDRNKLLHRIKTNLDDLRDFTVEMTSSKELSSVEVELALSRTRLLLQELEYLKEISERQSIHDEESHSPAADIPSPREAYVNENVSVVVEPVVDEPKGQDEEQAIECGSQFSEEENEPEVAVSGETVVEEPEATVVEEVEALKNDPEAELVEVEHEPVAVAISSKPIVEGTKKILVEQFESRSVNDLLAATARNGVRFSNTPIAKLENAIGLNDRFLYIRELFANNADLFFQTVRTIDEAGSLDQALVYLDQRFNWQQSDVSLQFMNLVRRRFTA